MPRQQPAHFEESKTSHCRGPGRGERCLPRRQKGSTDAEASVWRFTLRRPVVKRSSPHGPGVASGTTWVTGMFSNHDRSHSDTSSGMAASGGTRGLQWLPEHRGARGRKLNYSHTQDYTEGSSCPQWQGTHFHTEPQSQTSKARQPSLRSFISTARAVSTRRVGRPLRREVNTTPRPQPWIPAS